MHQIMPDLLSGKLRTRIAPTPSGFIHAGNAFSVLLTWALARKYQGEIVLRIDDLDASRSRKEYVQDIFDSLDWLGINWDEGPKNAVEFEKEYSQTLRIPLYTDYLSKFTEANFVFACTCSRSDLQDSEIYPGHCLHKNISLQGEEVSWRIKIPDSALVHFNDLRAGKVRYSAAQMGGAFIIRRKDKIPAYQIASLADDIAGNINFIVRGEDLLASTASQIYLAGLVNSESFSSVLFLHHPLTKQGDGLKLSKSKGANSLKNMREHSIQAAQIWNWFLSQFGYAGPAISKAEEIIDWIDYDKLKKLDAQGFHYQ